MLIQAVLVLALTGALVGTWKRASEGVISRREALLWSTAWIAAGAVVLRPETTTVIARYFGVGRGVDFVLYGSVMVLFFLVFKIFVALNALERKLTEMVRKEALDGLFGSRKASSQEGRPLGPESP